MGFDSNVILPSCLPILRFKDEFKIMTLDEVKEYMVDVINDITSFEPDELFTIIKNLEKLQ